MGPYSLWPCNELRVKMNAIRLCEANVRTFSKQQGEVKGVSHKVCEREGRVLKAERLEAHVRCV